VTRIPRSHPRYRSLVLRSDLAEKMARGVVVPEGLMAHGRGEAFDYLLGERSYPEALQATRAAAARLLLAQRPVLSVNGNVAALAANEVAALAKALPSLKVEVNLFHRTPGRAEQVAEELRRAGLRTVLGVHPTARLRGLPSDRGWVEATGILLADVVLVPLEDGDRAEALVRAGKFVIAVDLNPLSRTARAAQLPLVDELVRVLRHLKTEVVRQRRFPRRALATLAASVDGPELRAAALRRISARLEALAREDVRERPSKAR
jgi:4-phosphopantoate--beta-alanine ligase